MTKKLYSAKYKILMRYQEEVARSQEVKPEWLEIFLNRSYFNPCIYHPVRRNERGKYCITCDLSICQYCVSIGFHRHHHTIKVYKHVYQDVVLLAAMQKYIDCSQIQPYKCNKKMVLSLAPLPHSGTANPNASCKTCKRRLNEPDLYNYCSIVCKVKAFKYKTCESEPPFLVLTGAPTTTPVKSIQIASRMIMEKNSSMRSVERFFKRKGMPCRAPLF